MVRAPADWRTVLRRAEMLVRRRDTRSLELLLPTLRWRNVTARNRAVVLLARLGPMAVPALFARLGDAATAAERGGAADALGRIGGSRGVTRLIRALADPAVTGGRAPGIALVRVGASEGVARVRGGFWGGEAGGGGG